MDGSVISFSWRLNSALVRGQSLHDDAFDSIVSRGSCNVTSIKGDDWRACARKPRQLDIATDFQNMRKLTGVQRTALYESRIQEIWAGK